MTAPTATGRKPSPIKENFHADTADGGDIDFYWNGTAVEMALTAKGEQVTTVLDHDTVANLWATLGDIYRWVWL